MRTDSDRNLSAEADPNPARKTRERVLTVRWHDTQKEEILKGTIQVIDRYSGGYAEIDILSGDTIYKHFSLKDVISFGEL